MCMHIVTDPRLLRFPQQQPSLFILGKSPLNPCAPNAKPLVSEHEWPAKAHQYSCPSLPLQDVC